MKIKTNLYFIAALLLGFLYFPLIARAQTFDINSPFPQQTTISGPGFFPFSSISNNTFHNGFSQNMGLEATFTNFLGGPCTLAPAADFAEIGPPFTITGNSNFLLDFSMASQNAGSFGLSFVPKGSPCTFNLLITTLTTSSSSGNTISGNTITPNGISIFGTFLSDDLTSQLSNENNNPKCESSPSGIEPGMLSNQAFVSQLYKELLNRQAPQRTADLKALTSAKDKNSFTLVLPENKDKAMAVYNEKLTNNTDMTKIYVTGIFPSFSESSTSMSSARLDNPEIEVTLKEQDLVALAAVQHAIVSATMPWQLSKGNGFFITQGGGCVGPFCTIVESGMVVIVPGGACTPEKLNKRKAGYATFNPSMFFDPFPAAAKTIQIPAANIVDPKHPLVSKVVQDNAYLILQPVPPGARFTQQLDFSLNKKK